MELGGHEEEEDNKIEVIIRRATQDYVIREVGEGFNIRKDLMTTKQSH